MITVADFRNIGADERFVVHEDNTVTAQIPQQWILYELSVRLRNI